MNVFVVSFLEVALLVLAFSGSLFVSFMLRALYIPGALMRIHQPVRSSLQQYVAFSLLNSNSTSEH